MNLLIIEDVIVWIFSHGIKENSMQWEKSSNHHIPTLVDTDFCLCYTVRMVKGVDRAGILQSQKHKNRGSIMEVSIKSNSVEFEFSKPVGVYISHVFVPVYVNSNFLFGYNGHCHFQSLFNSNF